MLTHIERESIRKALEEATPGPWSWRKKKWDKGDGEWKDGEFNIGELRQKAELGQSYNSILDVQKNRHGQPDIYAWVEADAHIIANAPTWLKQQEDTIEQLLAEVRAKDAEIERITNERNEARTKAEEAWKEIDELEIALQSTKASEDQAKAALSIAVEALLSINPKVSKE